MRSRRPGPTSARAPREGRQTQRPRSPLAVSWLPAWPKARAPNPLRPAGRPGNCLTESRQTELGFHSALGVMQDWHDACLAILVKPRCLRGRGCGGCGMPAESKPSSFKAVIAAFTIVVTFALAYGYWKLASRQNEQDVRIEQQREEFQRSLLQLQRDADGTRAADNLELQVISLVSPHLAGLRKSGREAAASQRIVTAAAELLSSRGRPALAQMAEKIREQSAPAARAEPRPPIDARVASPPDAWLVLLATLPGDDLKLAEAIANDKLRAAQDLGLMPTISIYKTRLKRRYVVVLGQPLDRAAALGVAAQARRSNLSSDAFAEKDAGWELAGSAPFSVEVSSASSP